MLACCYLWTLFCGRGRWPPPCATHTNLTSLVPTSSASFDPLVSLCDCYLYDLGIYIGLLGILFPLDMLGISHAVSLGYLGIYCLDLLYIPILALITVYYFRLEHTSPLLFCRAFSQLG